MSEPYGEVIAVYKAKWVLRAVPIGLSLLAIIYVWLDVFPVYAGAGFLFMFPLIAGGASTLWFLGGRHTSKIILYQKGIEYHFKGTSIFAPWSDVLYFGYRYGSNGIFLYKAIAPTIHGRRWRLWTPTEPIKFIPTNDCVYVPPMATLEITDEHERLEKKLRSRAFGQLLYQYAPHLKITLHSYH
ncbi:MAG: hypothetical protein AAFV98_19210 [Chloroflexota bacterium]